MSPKKTAKVSRKDQVKAKLASLLGGSKKSKTTSFDAASKGSGSEKSRDRSDSETIGEMADIKVSNPTFVVNQKLTKRSFIRHVKAESQCHPHTPFNKAKNFFFGASPEKQSSSRAPVAKTDLDEESKDGSGGGGSFSSSKLISVRKLSQEESYAEESATFLRPQITQKNNDGTVPVRVVSQQVKGTGALFGNLAGDDDHSSSEGKNSSINDNAIEKLNLLEEYENES